MHYVGELATAARTEAIAGQSKERFALTPPFAVIASLRRARPASLGLGLAL
jgi:hypothetical protein